MKHENINLKRIIFASIFLSIFILGTVLISTTPSNIKIRRDLTVETKDGESVSFNFYKPIDGDKKLKAIIIGHGFIVNKEMLNGYAIELAAAGFAVVTLDFRGHGLSTGELNRPLLFYDLKAVKDYLQDRDDIDSHNLGYIGYSMGGGPGNRIVKDDDDFKCFIGIGTSLNIDYEDSLNRKLNILMILAKYDQAFNLKERKEEIADRVDIDEDNVQVNRLYGSFKDGNATKLFLDDNSDHFTTAYDQDFLREARDWVKNTFPDVDPVDQNFYSNLRFLILIMQIIGGIGFFFLMIEPLSKLILKKRLGTDDKENKKNEQNNDVISKNSKENLLQELNIVDDQKTLFLKMVAYSMLFAIPGMLIIILTVFLIMPLSMAGFGLALLSGQALGLLFLIWRYSKKSNKPLLVVLKKPFMISHEALLKQIILGISITAILYFILYLSIGLNYLGLIPSWQKALWLPIYLAIGVIIFLILGIAFQLILQNKFEDNLKGTLKASILIFSIMEIYTVSYTLLLCFLQGSFFFIQILYIGVPLTLISVIIAALLYQKTGNIVSGIIVNSLLFILILSTLSPYMLGLSYISVFSH